MPESMEDGLKLVRYEKIVLLKLTLIWMWKNTFSDKKRSSSNIPILTSSSVYNSLEGLKYW